MARARNIKPGFFKNADLVELPMEARLLFIGLWTLADRAGRLEDRPKQIKMEIFPADAVNVDAALEGLQQWDFVKRYEVNGRRLLQVVNFSKHQNPHKDEKLSVLPAPDGTFDVTPCKNGASTVQAQCKEDGSIVRTQCKDGAATVAIGLIPDPLIPDAGLLIPESGCPGSPLAPPPVQQANGLKRASTYTPAFERAWSALPRRPGDSKADAFKAWGARLKEGKSAELMTAGAASYAAYCAAEGTEPQFLKQGATFFGPGLHFESDWSVREGVIGKRQRLGGVGQLTDAARQAANDESDAEALRILSGSRTPGQEGISHG
ncbi:hypothetical protein J2X16_000788 [Pelomonas aquatica]|uniref:Phage replication protein O n=1 Tax=Pelomonas aquatica TaxID=431058 RepID=A0ABU1Z4B6_9BURK|nr:hypothetical protein [Pelomonas aquatica]MDR7295467.1 hypothetical protein [Pelomonas aquatica]